MIFWNRKTHLNDVTDDEIVEYVNNETDSVITQNPLMTLMNDDDPFEDEFT